MWYPITTENERKQTLCPPHNGQDPNRLKRRKWAGLCTVIKEMQLEDPGTQKDLYCIVPRNIFFSPIQRYLKRGKDRDSCLWKSSHPAYIASHHGPLLPSLHHSKGHRYRFILLPLQSSGGCVTVLFSVLLSLTCLLYQIQEDGFGVGYRSHRCPTVQVCQVSPPACLAGSGTALPLPQNCLSH